MMLFVLANILVVMAAVLIHHESLIGLGRLQRKLRIRHRLRVLVGVCGALLAHAAEVWLFAGVYFLMQHAQGWGRLTGDFDGSLYDCLYFSLTTFTTLGFGDIQPVGGMRFLTGAESLTGLVLISWTASFLFVEMQKFWDSRQG